MKGLKHLALAASLVAGVFTGQVAAREMTLADCISTALGANRGILLAGEAVAQARSGITGARSGFLPSLSASGSCNFLEKLPTVRFPLPGGGAQDVKVDFTEDYQLQLGLSQPLYAGGRISASYRISELTRDVAQADLDRERSDVALSVITSFYSLLLARESVKVAEEATKTAEEFLRVVQARYEAGEASSFEVMRAQVEVSNLEPALINARNGVALSELALKNAINIRPDEDVVFSGSFDDKVYEVDQPAAIRTALERRAELRMLSAEGRIAAEGLTVARAGRLPTVAVTANYNFISDKLKLDNDAWQETYNGYLVVSLPIFDGLKTKSEIARSRSEIKQSEIALANARDGIELEVRSSLLGLEAAVQALKSQEKNVGVAEEGLKIANDRYVQGLATNLDVMDAQLALTQARNFRLQALHDLNLATASLKRAMGVLLDDYK